MASDSINTALRQNILAAVQKLGDRDTADGAANELETLAVGLSSEQFAVLLHTLTESLGNQHYARHTFTRRYILQILGTVGSLGMRHLGRRQVSKLCATIFKHVGDSDSGVRETCADSFAVLAEGFIAVNIPTAEGSPETCNEVHLSLFLQFVFDALGARAQSSPSQVGAGLCLARMIARMPPSQVTPTLPRLCHRLGQCLKSRSCLAHTELLQALANIAEVCGEDLFPHAPVTIVLRCLHSASFETRVAAADVLATFCERLGPSMAGVAPAAMTELETVRFDKVKPVRDAVMEAIQLFRVLVPRKPSTPQTKVQTPPPWSRAARKARKSDGSTASTPRSSRADSQVSPRSTPKRIDVMPSSRHRVNSSPRVSRAESRTGESGTHLERASSRTDQEREEFGHSVGAKVETQISRWAAKTSHLRTTSDNARPKNRKKNRPARVPLFAQEPNHAFFEAQKQSAVDILDLPPPPTHLMEKFAAEHVRTNSKTATQSQEEDTRQKLATSGEDVGTTEGPTDDAANPTWSRFRQSGQKSHQPHKGWRTRSKDGENYGGTSDDHAEAQVPDSTHIVRDDHAASTAKSDTGLLALMADFDMPTPRPVGEAQTTIDGANSSDRPDSSERRREKIVFREDHSLQDGYRADVFSPNQSKATPTTANSTHESLDKSSQRMPDSVTMESSVQSYEDYYRVHSRADFAAVSGPDSPQDVAQSAGHVIQHDEWINMTAQLRKLSEQQQQLVTLVDTCFRGLDDRLMAVEAAVGGIHAHLGFAQRDM